MLIFRWSMFKHNISFFLTNFLLQFSLYSTEIKYNKGNAIGEIKIYVILASLKAI